MATQKQAEFIKSLVHNLKLENVEYLKRDTSTMKPDVLNHWNNYAKKDWMSDVMKLAQYDEDDNRIKRTTEEVEAEYRRRTVKAVNGQKVTARFDEDSWQDATVVTESHPVANEYGNTNDMVTVQWVRTRKISDVPVGEVGPLAKLHVLG